MRNANDASSAREELQEGFPTHEQTTALWTAAFFDELARCGVRDVVVSPGSRSTALAMAAFEMSRRCPDRLRLFVDVDERGAAFFGLGIAKASGRPCVLVCTSGTAPANYYPAVIEAETSRVPLIVLSGDRPPRLQGLGAPQTTDQLKIYGDHVRAFRAMPLPAAQLRDLRFARQAAREACLAATGAAGVEGATAHGAPADAAAAGGGSANESGGPQVASRACAWAAGPVHVNFPFEEPLKSDFAGADACAHTATYGSAEDAFAVARAAVLPTMQPIVAPRRTLDASAVEELRALLSDRRTLVLAGEGTCSTYAEAQEVAAWAHAWRLPVLADPLSGLRSVEDAAIIDAYDAALAHDDCPLPRAVIRFGRYPVSKRVSLAVGALHDAAAQGGEPFASIVVDVEQTRDFNAATDVFVAATPLEFVRSLAQAPAPASGDQAAFFEEWAARNAAARSRARAVTAAEDADAFEGAYVSAVLDNAPAGSCLFVANSMAVRAVDTFYGAGGRALCVLGNRGQNGIDGTVSTAIGAAQHFKQTAFITGDFTLQHDIGALALQHEMLVAQPDAPTVVIVLLNNDGGAIFDMLPQASDEAYFERLFLAPQNVDFASAAAAFHVPYRRAASVEEFVRHYRQRLCVPGISLIEVRVPLRGVKSRYGAYWN